MNRTTEDGVGGAEEPPDTAESAAVETTSSIEQNEDIKLKANEMPINSDAASAPLDNAEVDTDAAADDNGKDKGTVETPVTNKRKSPAAMETKPSAEQNEEVKVKADEIAAIPADETTPPVKKKRKSPAVPWKKPASMPKRPLSAYNLYFQDERKRLLLAKSSNKDSSSAAAAAAATDAETASAVALGVESERSSDELGASSRSSSSLTSGGTSRKHVAVSGLGFASLAKTVAAKWKSLDAVTKSPYEERAAQDKKRYDVQVADWREKQRKKKEEAKAAAAAAKKKKSSPSTPPTHPRGKGTEGISPPDHHSLGSISDTYPHDWFETGTAAQNVPGHVNALNDESSRTNTSSLYESSRTNASSSVSQHHQHDQLHQQLGDLSPMQEQQRAYHQQISSLPTPLQQGPVNPFAGDDLLSAPPQNGYDSLYFNMQAQSVRGGNNIIYNMPAVEAFGCEPFNPHQYQQQQPQQGPQRQVPLLSSVSDMNIPQNRSLAFSLQPRRMMATSTSSSNTPSSSLQDEDLRFFGQAPPMGVTSFRVQADAAAQNNMSSQSSSTMSIQVDQGGYPQFEQKLHDSNQDSTISNSNRFSQSPFDPPSRSELGYHRPMNSGPMDGTLMAAPTSRLQLRNFQPPPTGIQQQSHMRLQQQQHQNQQQQQEQFQSQWGLGGGLSSSSSSSMQPQPSQNIDVNNPNAHDDSNNIGLGHIRRVEEMRAEDVIKQQRLQHQQFLERQQRQQQQMQEQQRRQQMLEHQRRQQLLEEQRMLQQRQLQVQQQLQQHSLQPDTANASTGSGGGETLFSIRESLDDDMILFLTHLQNGSGGSGADLQQQQQGDYAFPLPPST